MVARGVTKNPIVTITELQKFSAEIREPVERTIIPAVRLLW